MDEIPLSPPKPYQPSQSQALSKPIRKPRQAGEPSQEKPQPKFRFEFQILRYKDVIGMKRTKALMHKLLDLPLKKPLEFEQLGVKKSVGIILYGPPGVGKSFLTKAVCGELGIKMAYITVSSILSKYVGESAGNIKLLFEEAKKNEPCAIFIDEADILLQNRENISGEGGSSEMKSTVSQLLQETTSVHDNPKSHIYILAATNLPWNIDPANKRSGRFEYLLYIKPPTFSEREQLFKLYIGREASQFREKFGRINYFMLAMCSADFSPADIEKVVKAAKINAMEKDKTLITTRTLQRAFWSREAGKSSLDDWYIELYQKYLIKKKNILKSIFSKKYRQQEPEKTKLDKADMELYRELIQDVERHKAHRWYIKIVRVFGKGFPQLSVM